MKNVAIVYHFFAHYRHGIIQELCLNSAINYIFVGDLKDPLNSGIKSANVIPSDHFIFAPCYHWRSVLIQKGLLRLALKKDIGTIIFLGDPHYLVTWISAALARICKKRVLYWTHGWTRDERNGKDKVRCLYYAIAHGLLLYGDHAKKLASRRGFRPENLYVIGNSLDYENQKKSRHRVTPAITGYVRSKLFEVPQRPMLICSCRLRKKKRLDLLLDAMVILEKAGTPMNLLLVGDGPEKSRLEAIVAENNLAVKLLGACYEEDLLSVLTMAADLTVAPGEVGLTAMQSMAYGTPVITHDDKENQGPEWEAIVPGKTGDFFLRDNSNDLARVISRWLNTRKTREQVRSACYEIIEKKYNPKVQRLAIERAVHGLPPTGWNMP